MKQYKYPTRQEYLKKQIERSRNKIGFCKVHFEDLARYKDFLFSDLKKSGEKDPLKELSPILCLGVRSGAEVDMFRAVFYGPLLRGKLLKKYLYRQDKGKEAMVKIHLARRFGFGARKDLVQGVELNPDSEHKNVWVGSFDDMPTTWTDRYRLLYSNSFDHSQNPQKTVREWKRVAAKGAYLIIAFTPETKPSETDPLGGLSIDTMQELWQAELVHSSDRENRNGYHEVIFRL